MFSTMNRRFLTLAQRERVLISSAVLLVILLVGYLIFVEPSLIQGNKDDKKLTQAKMRIEQVENELNAVKLRLAEDPNEPVKNRLKSLNERIQRVQQALESQTTQLVLAQQMPVMLRQILEKTDSVKLISLTSLAPRVLQEEVSDAPTNSGNTSGADEFLYQHGVRMEIEGSYFDIQAYLGRLKGLDWRIYWQHFDYQSTEYPLARAKLELYTISTNASFLGL